jgi:hypothetical protein
VRSLARRARAIPTSSRKSSGNPVLEPRSCRRQKPGKPGKKIEWRGSRQDRGGGPALRHMAALEDGSSICSRLPVHHAEADRRIRGARAGDADAGFSRKIEYPRAEVV